MTRRVLVVDDDRSMVRTLGDVLAIKGWEVASAFSGEEAVNAAAAQPYDVVLMDVKMPGMDGVEAFKAIRQLQPVTPVVLMTAYAAQDRLAEAERAGVWRVLPKPLNVAALVDLLASALTQARPVLICDSDAAFLRTLSEVLRLRGYATVNAVSVDDAVRLMNEECPVAVLLHTNTGKVTMQQAMKRVHDANPSAAVVLYSGRADAEQEIREHVPADWVRAYLHKPFAIDEMMTILDAIRATG